MSSCLDVKCIYINTEMEMVTVMIEVTDNCCCCVSLYLDIGSPQPGQERGGGVGTVRRTAELGREQSSSNLYPKQYLNIR